MDQLQVSDQPNIQLRKFIGITVLDRQMLIDEFNNNRVSDRN